jgi:hypothetical protein
MHMLWMKQRWISGLDLGPNCKVSHYVCPNIPKSETCLVPCISEKEFSTCVAKCSTEGQEQEMTLRVILKGGWGLSGPHSFPFGHISHQLTDIEITPALPPAHTVAWDKCLILLVSWRCWLAGSWHCNSLWLPPCDHSGYFLLNSLQVSSLLRKNSSWCLEKGLAWTVV